MIWKYFQEVSHHMSRHYKKTPEWSIYKSHNITTAATAAATMEIKSCITLPSCSSGWCAPGTYSHTATCDPGQGRMRLLGVTRDVLWSHLGVFMRPGKATYTDFGKPPPLWKACEVPLWGRMSQCPIQRQDTNALGSCLSRSHEQVPGPQGGCPRAGHFSTPSPVSLHRSQDGCSKAPTLPL